MQENITIYPHIFNTLSIDFIMTLSNTLKKFLCEFIVCCLPEMPQAIYHSGTTGYIT